MMRTWTQSDIYRLICTALDTFAWEHFNVRKFEDLPRGEKLEILRALKADAAGRHANEWLKGVRNRG